MTTALCQFCDRDVPDDVPHTCTPPRVRQPLTEADALAGVQPTPMTRAEWDAMHDASARETREKHFRLCDAWWRKIHADLYL